MVPISLLRYRTVKIRMTSSIYGNIRYTVGTVGRHRYVLLGVNLVSAALSDLQRQEDQKSYALLLDLGLSRYGSILETPPEFAAMKVGFSRIAKMFYEKSSRWI